MQLIGVFSGMATVGCLLVWASQCLAFVRFYFGYDFNPGCLLGDFSGADR